MPGVLAKTLEFIRKVTDGIPEAEVKGDPGGGRNIRADHYGPIGDDSQPLTGDEQGDNYHTTESTGAGRHAVVGWHDPKNQGKSEKGEVRRYARKLDGTQIAEVWLRNDGTIHLRNLDGQEFGLEITKELVKLAGGDDFVALAAKTKAEIESLRDWAAGHDHSTTATIGLAGPATVSTPLSPPPAVGEVAAEKVKAT